MTGAGAVKPRGGSPRSADGTGLRRHLEGWQVGAVLVGLALLTAAVVAPRGVAPVVVPLPVVDRPEQRREARLDDERADAAVAERLPFEVRALGELIRRHGRSVAAADSSGAADAEERIRAMVPLARAHGDESVLRLRAVQTRLFLGALASWEVTAEQTGDLVELGGDFLTKSRASGWVDSASRVRLTVLERATLYRIRWGTVTGLLRDPRLAPSANEWRVYYRLLLRWPEGAATDSAHSVDRRRMDYVAAVAKYDPSYPDALARGVLSFRLGAYKPAVELFRAHLGRHPGGQWSLRARNHLAEARARHAENPIE